MGGDGGEKGRGLQSLPKFLPGLCVFEENGSGITNGGVLPLVPKRCSEYRGDKITLGRTINPFVPLLPYNKQSWPFSPNNQGNVLVQRT